ncbi:Helicase superfamily 1/2, ATP-binding domain [Fusarium oxysporum f. sp. vasinfectum]|nr:Helicase superfamily 1/2, ATP-binding domain [Fusarium oxysporum f. sp. vasinfectum]
MVTRKQVKLHLRSAPHSLNSQEISIAQEWASKHDIFEGQLEAHDNLPPRPDDAPPIAALGPPGTGGIRCEFIPERSTSSRPNCPYVGAELRRIREHLRVKHDWDMELKGGRRSAAMTDEERSNSPWRTGVCYQRLFSSGPGSELFEVARGLNLEQSRAQDNESQAALQRAVDAFQSKGKDIRSREAERIDEENDFTAPNPWLRRLGSAIHLKDFSGKKDLLRGLIVMEYEVDPDDPDKSDDAQLRFIHIAFDRLVNHAKAVITPDIVSWNALFEVNRKELMKERTKPFHFRFKPETQRRYALVVKQLLAYIVRCMSFENKADRPPFKLSTRQQRAYDATMEHADDLTDAWKENGGDPEAPEIVRLLDLLETAVLELYISVLDHFTKDTEYDSVLVSFLTVLSVRADGTWEGYEGFTPKLSAIMAISRLCIIKYAVDQRAKTIKQKMQQGQSQEEAEENSPSHFALISEMTRRFMVGGGEGWETTPTQFIIRLRNFGMAAQNNTAAHGSVSWDKGREELIYKGIRLSVLDVQAMMRLAVQQLEIILYKDLLLFTEYSEQSPAELGLPEIPWDQLLDNAANETIGHSFIDTLFQRDGGASKGWVIKKVLQDSSLRSKWIKSIGDNGVEINLRMAYRYGLRIEKALELLAVLAHISGGFPLRAWELLVVRHRNTSNGGIRNILCDQGLIMIVTGAHKGFTTTGRLKIIHRFLPREVGTLLTYYLWLVLPFWEDIQANVWDKSIFNAGLWATEGTQESERQQDGDQADAAIEASQAQASQDGEGGQDGWKLGPGEHWTSPRLSRSIRRLSVLACGQKLNISSWRHISTAIGRRYFRNASTAHTRLLHEVDSDDSGSESDSDEDSPYDLQAGHGSKTAGLIYGRLVTEGAFETNERRVNFRYISEEWHRLLGFPSAMGGFGEVLTPGRKRKNASICDEALRKLQLERWKSRRRINIDRELVYLYGEQARFRGVQREAIHAIMMNKSPIVVVMGTGGGKSLSFMLPAASCPGGVTVVVVPLVSLQGDLMERCRKMKIPCAEWRSDQSPGPASLVFVTPESAMTKRFHDYVEGLRVMAQLDGFVFDEAHTILEGTRDFRPKLRELGRLGLVGVQMVYLTATLPPSKEEEFFELINARSEDVTMIRTSTSRANVVYSVQTDNYYAYRLLSKTATAEGGRRRRIGITSLRY